MTFEIGFMLVLLVVALVSFVKELFPIEVTALGLLGVLVLSGVVSPGEAVTGFSNRAAITIGALFVLSYGLLKTGVLNLIADQVARRAGRFQWLGIGVLLLAVGLLSGFLNNTAVVAIFIPLLIGLCGKLDLSPSKVLIPLSYVSIFGGTLTLIGTSTNLLVSSVAAEAGEPPLRMFEFSQLGIFFLVLGLAYVMLLGPRLLPARAEPGPLTLKYAMEDYLTELQVQEGSDLVGQSCRDVGVNEKYDITVLSILRAKRRIIENIATQTLQADDVLIVRGGMDNIVRFKNDHAVALLTDIHLTDEELEAEGSVMVEALLPQTSTFIGKTLKQLDFRRRYGGFVLAVRRHGETLRSKVADVRFAVSDTLLLLIERRRLQELQRNQEVIVISEPELELERDRFWWLVLLIVPVVVFLAAAGIVEIMVGALLGAILLLLVGVVTPQEAYRAVDWSVIFLIVAFVPMGHAMIETGTAAFIAGGITALGGLFDPEWAPFIVLSAVYLMTSLLTQMVSNNATAIMLVPIVLSVAAALGVDSRPFLIAVCFAASAEFMTPMGYQTNLMVFGPGNYRFMDYVKFGAPLNISFWILASLLIPVFWAF